MARSALHRLMPGAPPAVLALLDPGRGAIEPPIRAEIFGPQRFQQHGRSLGATHEARIDRRRSTAFFPRLRDNIAVLREAHHYIGQQERTGQHVSPAGEWLLDNFHIVGAQLKEIVDGLPRRYFQGLPVLAGVHLAGLPRIYGVAWAFVAHTDSAFDEALLIDFLDAYQERRELNLGELWALPTTLRVVLIENLRRLAERVAASKAARELANRWCDQLADGTAADPQPLSEALEARDAARAFALQVAQRLHHPSAASFAPADGAARRWLATALPDPAGSHGQQQAEQTANNLSVSNAITALRLLGDTDWRALIERTGALMQLMQQSPAYRAERDDTQDTTLHAIERLARRSGASELAVARALLVQMEAPTTGSDADDPTHSPRYWLSGPGQPMLRHALGARAPLVAAWGAWRRRLTLPAYLGTLLIGSLLLTGWVLIRHGFGAATWPLTALLVLLIAGPASEAVIALVNRLISESAQPRRLPRLALEDGILPEHRVLVVVPTLLTSAAGAQTLVSQLERHHLANPEDHAQFALLGDYADADTVQTPADAELLAAAARALRELNLRYPVAEGASPRFLLLHRERQFSETEQRWIGWERKRGKLEQLIDMLADAQAASPFIDLGELSRPAPATPYVVTLDSDTKLPPGSLRELVGVAAHPLNQPRIDATRRRVSAGYGILQPRVLTPLPPAGQGTPFHWLFAGQCGVDPYSAASSEIYQDLFAEGTFTGKGLLHVQALRAVLSGRLPEDAVLSHDLLEGSMARCGGVSDIALIEDAPMHPDVAASRVHRWTRGDWQLLPLLARAGHYGIGAINRWKMIDNLRRSLVAPTSLALLALSLAGWGLSPMAALLLIGAAFGAGPLLGAVAGLAPSRDDIALRHFAEQALTELVRALGSTLWQLAMLLQNALLAADAVLRAGWRMAVSRRHLLQWTTADAAHASAGRTLGAIARQHLREPLVAAALLVALFAAGTPTPLLATALCVLWAGAPLLTWWASRPRRSARQPTLTATDRDYLLDVARDTWRFFEHGVGAADHDLPPDNVQTLPRTMVAHRTSPTNIGLYLVALACARRFGWIGSAELLARGERTLATLAALPRHRGHLLNWVDTQTLQALLPAYVSTVDSGNLCGCLIALAQACEELGAAPFDDDASAAALAASRRRLATQGATLAALAAPDGAIHALLALPAPLGALHDDPAGIETLLRRAGTELEPMLPATAEPAADGAPPPLLHAAWLVRDHLATLRSVADDHALRIAGIDIAPRLLALASACRRLAEEAEFGFLFNRRRRLFHIGYRVAEQQLDTSFYDLLASESRFASLWAIARAEVPVAHWAALGRPFFAEGRVAGLRSWSGSMFEYLMPTLLLDEAPGSVLASAARAALRAQMAFARAHGVPWGISESAYAGSDHTLAYQYAPQGVPKLALRRTPADELVIAPYATALAALVEPGTAVANLRRLEALQARGAMGFIEALDYSPERQAGSAAPTRVSTFMAHHQGMTIAALANVLLEAAPRRWAMAEPRLQAVASLLQERLPREVSLTFEPAPAPSSADRRQSGPTLRREIVPGTSALQPTHLLSNGRYSVALRANGAGWSRFGNAFVSRWRDDALRDAHGSFLYLRRGAARETPGRPKFPDSPSGGRTAQDGGLGGASEAPFSLSQHPAADPGAHYEASFHHDRVCLDAQWPDLHTRCTVWVSPEDDIELRQIELSNLGGQPIELELLSAFEVSLAEARADEAHPAFAKLFVRADWNAADRALYFERRPRLSTEPGLHAVHFVAQTDEQVVGVRAEADREHWLGRQRDGAQPLARFVDLATPADGDSVELRTGLDPVAALSLSIRLPAHGSARLSIATAAAPERATLEALVDKYRQPSIIERSSLMSATLAGIRLRDMRTSSTQLAAIQTLSTTLALLPTRAIAATDASNVDRRALWRFGISADRPLLLVDIASPEGMGLVRTLVQALKLWTWGGLPCDLVVVDGEPASYLMLLQRELAALGDRFRAETDAALPAARACALHVLRVADISAAELASLHALARVHINADGRPLSQHVEELVDLHNDALDERRTTAVTALAAPLPALASRPVQGEFSADGARFGFDVSAARRPPRPWINVLANPDFGAQISESGAGYTWAGNSRLHQLTPWSNDPVGDPAGEWLLLQDLATREVWNLAPGAGAGSSVYRVEHGQGSTRITHRRAELELQLTWCVDAALALKQVQVDLVNHGARTRRLRLVGLAEWTMGAARVDRQTVLTSRVPGTTRLLTATQRDDHAGFGGSTAFAAWRHDGSAEDSGVEWTCDRREFFDARGRLVLPDHLGEQSGAGLDPCAALALPLSLAPGARTGRTWLLGHGATPEAALALAREALAIEPVRRLQAAHAHWDALLGTLTVVTPDPLFDALVNRWLLYQTVGCRLWARAGFYQAGGAFGFRDQLQDAMALAVVEPALLRRQLLLAASRQFPEGDVQHWWHAPTGVGVRTHFSDDLLWLAHATVHYLDSSGDTAVLDEALPFLEGDPIPPGAEDAYFVPRTSALDATLYEHCARAIDRSLAVGAHGLPLMGSGDWNDGMNRVGIEGRGESVWLGWFLCRLVAEFAPIAQQRGDAARARRWRSAARGWRAALLDTAWDGEWFMRAFFDDGSPLGSRDNAECRIDLIAQAWSVLSGMAPRAQQETAMASVERLLVDPVAGLVRLLDPPLANAQPSAGYIQAYPRGVRENGGQYSHGGVWALMAHAALGNADAAWRMFERLSPAHRSADLLQGAAYGLEPYVMAGDICSQPPYAGRGGWSWYTGSAAWMHRAAIESIVGLQLRGQRARLRPQLPSHWPQITLRLRREQAVHEFIVCAAAETARIEQALASGATRLRPGVWLALDDPLIPTRHLVVVAKPNVAAEASIETVPLPV
ncbi:GH36-type glycosyl hydrolase domain-containing protein [Rivibacter subsaxonicus]|uniref:Cyclic beta-1,2-glucan synthetase n=1 Tax=Rivibacter subsaxonicus TaxID=457575 RepID=A0A4Q7VN32_9BURK|nr:glucoamylase family protein [Rivibacter subsaxonicus]RZT97756.1 cyclic beta-1,2-glucan synthetase [Rivibacter subsaxonicus]